VAAKAEQVGLADATWTNQEQVVCRAALLDSPKPGQEIAQDFMVAGQGALQLAGTGQPS
jgi:hypothetical protein